MSASFNFADYYAGVEKQAADDLATIAAVHAENPTRDSAVRLRMAIEKWEHADSVARAMSCHKL